MRAIKGFLKKIDVFAMPLSFKYKGNNYYATSLGGISIILILIIILVVGIYYFIPFINRKNFSVIYYTMNLSKTESIIFKESRASFAYGFDCEKIINNLTLNDIVNLDSKYIVYTKNTDGTFNKQKYKLATHSCNYADFYNNYNNSVDYLNLGKYECLNDNSHPLEGIFSDQVFSYYEFSAYAKTGTQQNFDDINNLLMQNDCKFQIYYTDITFDLVNYEEPIKPYLNSLFIQFDPTLFIKRNIFFMNQYLYDDDYLIWNFGDDVEPEKRTLFSRYEEYALYQGIDRLVQKPPDYMNYAKMYIRADTRRTDIKRKYQKLVEFYADLSSIMITLYRLMVIFFNYVSIFYAMHSVSKRIFFFKNIENNNYNVFRKYKHIYDLIYLTETYSTDKIIKEDSENEKRIVTNPNSEKENISDKGKNSELTEINIYKKNNINMKGNQSTKKIENKAIYENHLSYKYQEGDFGYSAQSRKKLKTKNENNDRTESIYKRRYEKIDANMNMKTNKGYNKISFSSNSNNCEKNSMNSSDRTEIEKIVRKRKRHKKINYTFNIIETIFVSFCQCCLWKNLKRKNNLNEKANNILYNKLDIVFYVRNMLLFDLINDTFLDEPKKYIFNFLCRPVISLYQKEGKYPPEFYNKYNETDFNNFSLSVNYYAQKQNKEKEEKRLICLCNQRLREMI